MPNTPTKPPMPEPSAFEVVACGRRQKLVSRADVADEIAQKWREIDADAGCIALYSAAQLAARDAQWLAYAEALAAERVREGREACAELAESFDACDPKHVANAIRARKD